MVAIRGVVGALPSPARCQVAASLWPWQQMPLRWSQMPGNRTPETCQLDPLIESH